MAIQSKMLFRACRMAVRLDLICSIVVMCTLYRISGTYCRVDFLISLNFIPFF